MVYNKFMWRREAVTRVTTEAELAAALDDFRPGDTIELTGHIVWTADDPPIVAHVHLRGAAVQPGIPKAALTVPDASIQCICAMISNIRLTTGLGPEELYMQAMEAYDGEPDIDWPADIEHFACVWAVAKPDWHIRSDCVILQDCELLPQQVSCTEVHACKGLVHSHVKCLWSISAGHSIDHGARACCSLQL